MTEQQDDLIEQFIYPINPKLKKAYFAVVAEVMDKKRVVFTPVTLIEAIREYMEWPDDSNSSGIDGKTGRAVPPGTHFRKAKNLLKALEGKFTKFNGNGLEVIVYRTDGSRVRNFSDLETLCALDIHMSEVVATSQKLDPDQPWEDKFVLHPTYQMSDQISQIDTATLERKRSLEGSALRQTSSELRNRGIVSGKDLKGLPYNVPDDLYDEDLNQKSEKLAESSDP